MNIGDKVRSMEGNEEGIITGFLNKHEVEVEIEDGFRIPFLLSDLVLVHRQEEEFFARKEKITKKEKSSPKKENKTPRAEKGFYLAFLPQNDTIFDTCLINNTDMLIAYSIGEFHARIFYGLKTDVAAARSWTKISTLSLKEFDNWPDFVVQAIFSHSGVYNYRPPLEKKIRIKTESFYKSKKTAPIIEQPAHLFQLDGQATLPSFDSEKIRTEMLSPGKKKHTPKIKPSERKNIEIDLHIQKIEPNYAKIPKESILEIQLAAFEKSFDEALTQGCEIFTVIHGVGNGVLRTEIQRKVSGHPQVAYFKDARREKFGYGATEIKIE